MKKDTTYSAQENLNRLKTKDRSLKKINLSYEFYGAEAVNFLIFDFKSRHFSKIWENIEPKNTLATPLMTYLNSINSSFKT